MTEAIFAFESRQPQHSAHAATVANLPAAMASRKSGIRLGLDGGSQLEKVVGRIQQLLRPEGDHLVVFARVQG